MAIPAWQQILSRGQQTTAVWQQHSPAFTVRGLTLAQHQTDVNALAPKAQEMEDAQEGVDDARAARETVQKTVASMNTQLPRKLDGDLLPSDAYHKDLKDIRGVFSDTGPGTLTRGQKVLALWKKLNARNAAASPVIPPLLVGGVALAAFQAHVENLDNLQQTVEDKESILADRREELRVLSARVDQNNKRWYAAWQGEFLPGSPEYAALSQITTEGGGSGDPGNGGGGEPPEPPLPPQNATFTQGNSGDPVTADAEPDAAATLWEAFARPAGSSDAPVLVASGAALPLIFTHSPGDFEFTLRKTTPAGQSAPSEPVTLTVS